MFDRIEVRRLRRPYEDFNAVILESLGSQTGSIPGVVVLPKEDVVTFQLEQVQR